MVKVKEKEAQAALHPLLRELFQVGLYKKSQGRIARQITCGVMWTVIGVGAWRLWETATNTRAEPYRLAYVSLFVIVGGWIAYRLVNMPSFADFLIAVEAEMNKVSWPSRGELVRSSLVVICSIVFLALILLSYDLFWTEVLRVLRIVR
jgi:preprotein translocase subunit SecE